MNTKYRGNNLSNGSKLEIGEDANGNVSKQELANIYEIYAVQK